MSSNIIARVTSIVKKYRNGKDLLSDATVSIANLARDENVDLLYSLLPKDMQKELELVAEHAHKGGRWRVLGASFQPNPIMESAKEALSRWHLRRKENSESTPKQ